MGMAVDYFRYIHMKYVATLLQYAHQLSLDKDLYYTFFLPQYCDFMGWGAPG